MALYLRENLNFSDARIEFLTEDRNDGKGKDLYMKGIFLQGGVKNHNERIYPVNEISKAVSTIMEQIKGGYSVLGEVDHPDDLKINLDRVSHMITDMWMDGPNGFGKLKILPTPMGKLVETMMESGVKLGVSSRGSGNVSEGNGHVSDFDIVTVDVVAQPSAPQAYPTAIYEGLMNMKGGAKMFELAKEASVDAKVQKYLKEQINGFIKELKIKQEISMLNAIKPLLESGIINEATQEAITEAWETQINEAREQVRTELREEFARRYDHDKNVMVEALDKMVTESLTAELVEFAEEKRTLAEDRVKFKRHMVESAGRFDQFMIKNLSNEIQELRTDRKVQQESIKTLENFVIRALAEEIREFEQDKQAVVETKVKLVAEANTKLAELQDRFVKRSAKLVKESVSKNLVKELSQLKEDIHAARENMFGRKLFEAFASEFAVTHLNESREFAKLNKIIDDQNSIIAEAKTAVKQNAVLVESRNREIRMIKESAKRKEIMSDLLGTLNKEKATVMRDLLEGVQTDKIRSAYDKYLPAVLNNSAPATKPAKGMLAESRKAFTGDKSAKTTLDISDNVIELKRLAGLN